MEKYVAYYRVSTKKQETSGLGLESQKAIVLSYLNHKKVALCNEFTEVESGKVNNRVELTKAIKVCSNVGAVLCIAKLDRLSRNVSFISSLMESRVKFVCCDMPEANEFTIHIFSALAQQERKMISSRTKNALHAKMVRDNWKAGTNNLNDILRAKGREVVSTNARNDISVRHALHFIRPLKESGYTYQYIADMLNSEGYKTRTGKSFHAQQVWNIVQRFEGKQIAQ
jgi:DNA invertase Pin-like site-specific DNA recombinase